MGHGAWSVRHGAWGMEHREWSMGYKTRDTSHKRIIRIFSI